MPHGLTITESTSGVRQIKQASLAEIGLIATAGAVGTENVAKLDAAFPLNTLVLVSNIDLAIGNAGTTGTLAPALNAIADQTTPLVAVVRVAEGADQAETEANVIGGITDGRRTGMQALLDAETVLGLRPRILGAPGLDTRAVTDELIVIAQRLRAMAYARALGDTITEATNYRKNFGARELMLFWPDTSRTFAGDFVARQLGNRARTDEEQGWHKTSSNIVLNGVSDLTHSVHFDLLDPSTDAGVLNDAQVTTIIRQDGFRVWGNRTCAGESQPEYAFESAVRTLHALQDELVTIVRPFFDQPMTAALIKDLLEAINRRYRQLTREGRIIGGEVFFDEDRNPPEQLNAGRPTFRIQFTPCAPMENPQVQMVITDYYYTGFASQVAA